MQSRPHPSPLPEGEGARRRELQAGASEIKRKGAGQAPFDAVIAAISLYVVLIRKLDH